MTDHDNRPPAEALPPEALPPEALAPEALANDEDKREGWASSILSEATAPGGLEALVWIVSLPFRVIAWMVGTVLELIASLG
jgi:hypothetical protein